MNSPVAAAGCEHPGARSARARGSEMGRKARSLLDQLCVRWHKTGTLHRGGLAGSAQRLW